MSFSSSHRRIFQIMTVLETKSVFLLEMTNVVTVILSTLTMSVKGCNKLNTTCCYNEYFNTSTRTCLDCRPGHIGWNCETPCKKGYYGNLCSTPCKCEAHLCDKETGCRSRQNETVNYTNDYASEDHYLVLVSLSIMVFAVAVLMYFRWGIKRFVNRSVNICLGRDSINSQGCIESHILQPQDCPSVEIVHKEKNACPNYDEIRYSQLSCRSSHCVNCGQQSSGDRAIEYPAESELTHFNGLDTVNEEDYSRLVLTNNQVSCIIMNINIFEDDEYAILQTNDIKETDEDVSIK